MKLSAPPPPPPPPPPEGAPGSNDPTPPPADAAPPEAPAPEAPPEPPAPKPLRWPAWYAGVDAALAGLVLVLAFAAASFVATNSDVWLHLAAGKRLLAGQYTPGSDPFSYSAADRAWVNHSWLLDAVAYLLYGGKGIVLVVAKALVVTLAFGLLMAIRRSQFPLWPWAAVTCVAVLASAPQFTLRPLVVSMLWLSVTLYLVFRMPQKADSWRFPVAIGVTFWLWANSDPWFFVGPLALALLLVGELIQTKILGPSESPPTAPPAPSAQQPPAPAEPDEPLGRLPDVGTLAKALAVGVLACMLNPHHVRVWELPFELVGAPGIQADPRLTGLLRAPTDGVYMQEPVLGANLNGVAYAVLLVAGAAVLGFGPGRVRVSHVALWVGFAALSLLSVYAIPFFAIVAVPLVAGQLNALGARAELKTWGDPRSRVLLLGSSIGRIASVLAVCALVVLAYPGWVHPEDPNPARARRVAWGVEPEPSLAAGAEQFKKWRETGRLPADARGLIANTDLANYVAWFAPQEKVFVNSRYNHHKPELADYVALRRGLGLVEVKDERPNPKEAADVLKKTNAEFVAIHAGPADSSVLRTRAGDVTAALNRDYGEWSPWYLDGRTAVFGWRAPGEAARPSFAQMRIDPVALAFGPAVARLPDPELKQPLAPLGWEEPFVRPARPAPVGAAESRGWMRYKEALVARHRVRGAILREAFFAFPALPDSSPHRLALWAADGRNLAATPVSPDAERRVAETMPLIWYLDGRGALRFSAKNSEADDDFAGMWATPLLALRAVRRAIAEDPDHPDPYYALAFVLRDAELPLSESERVLGRMAAYRQCLSRLPPPERFKRSQFAANPVEVCIQLATLYLGPKYGRQDPRTGQETVAGYLGVPIDVAPLNELLGQTVFEDPTGRLVRIPARGQVKLPTGFRSVTGNTPHFLSIDLAREVLKLALAYAQGELAGPQAEAAKKDYQEIERFLKEVEAAVIRVNEQYDQLKARAPGLPGLVDAARYTGLTGGAIELLSDPKADLTKEYKDRLPEAAVLRVALELATGRVENADELLRGLDTPESAATMEKAGLAVHVLRLKYQKALAAGEYAAAGAALETMGGRSIGALDKLPPAGPTVSRSTILELLAITHGKQSPQEAEPVLAAMLGPPVVPLTPLTQPLVRELWQGEWLAMYELIRRQILNQLQNEAEFFYRRGVLSLLEGDIPGARQRFRQAARKPPKGWDLPDIVHTDALRYQRMIEIAERKPVW